MTWQTHYDRWATGGRYSREVIAVTCPACGEVTEVLAETEYGATDWSKEECGSCETPFPDDVMWETAEPPE